jgi:hypothetical protein
VGYVLIIAKAMQPRREIALFMNIIVFENERDHVSVDCLRYDIIMESKGLLHVFLTL